MYDVEVWLYSLSAIENFQAIYPSDNSLEAVSMATNQGDGDVR